MKKLFTILTILSIGILLMMSCGRSANKSALETPCIAADTEFDLVILNGRVIDPESNFDGIRNVGIVDGRIVCITEESISGKETIEATGKIVAPGFIDTHFHWQEPQGHSFGLRDGLTSAMDLEIGTAGTYVAKWYEVRKGVSQVNCGTASSHELARSIAIDGAEGENLLIGYSALLETRKKSGWNTEIATEKTGNEILQIIDQGLQAGAIGIGSSFCLMIDGVTAREMYEVQKLGAQYGRLTAVHTEFTTDKNIEENVGSQEFISNAIVLGAPTMVQLFNNSGWRLAYEQLTRLQDKGLNIWAEIYPYALGSTPLNAEFLKPENWVEKLGNTYEKTLVDPETKEFYTLERYNADIGSNPTRTVILYKMPEEEAPKWLTLKGANVSSNAVGADLFSALDDPLNGSGMTHPPTSGVRGRTLRIGREYNIPMTPLMAILSYNAAKHLGDTGLTFFQERCRMQQGMIADIVVFDPEKVTDNPENVFAPTTGMNAVIVTGKVTVKNDQILNVFAGQPIRFAPEKEQRFEHVPEYAWNVNLSHSACDHGGHQH